MGLTDISVESRKTAAPQVAQGLGQSLEDFLSPLLRQLDEQIELI